MSLTQQAPPDAEVRAGRFHKLRIAAVQRETADAISLAFEVPPELRSQFAFRPGQYLTLRTTQAGAELRRSYSICSGLDDGALRVAIKRVEGGQFSGWAHGTLQPGHVIEAMPPAGRFTPTLDPDAARTYLGVAAGSGITPILSILKSMLARESRSRFILLYGSRRTADILFREELEELKDRAMARLTVVHVLSREQQDIPVLNGRLDGAKVTALMAGVTPDLALLCGPGGMIRSVTTALEAAGLAPDQVLSERFVLDGEAPPPRAVPIIASTAATTATIVADGIRTAVPVEENETVLAAALRAGLDLPYSCRGGMCSTCRAKVTEGAVRMDVNYGLEPWETAAGYVLTCQSHLLTATVTVDYDAV